MAEKETIIKKDHGLNLHPAELIKEFLLGGLATGGVEAIKEVIKERVKKSFTEYRYEMWSYVNTQIRSINPIAANKETTSETKARKEILWGKSSLQARGREPDDKHARRPL